MTGRLNASPTTDERRSRYAPSTAQILSLVTGGIVVVVLTTVIVVVWITLRQSAIATAHDRMSRGATQLSAVVASGVRQAQARYAAEANDSAIRRALSTATPPSTGQIAAARAALEQLQTRADSGLPYELWRADGKRIAFVGDDLSEPLRLNVPREGSVAPIPHPGLDSLKPTGALQLGNLYRVGTRTMFWIVMPVRSAEQTTGFIAHQVRIQANPEAKRTIEELSANADGYYRNVDGTTWTQVGGTPASPPVQSPGSLDQPEGKVEYSRPGVGAIISDAERVAGSPLVIVMEVSRSAVLAPVNATVGRLAIFGAILTVVGVLAAWGAGGRMARPIARLTEAAEAVSHGDYSARVPTTANAEVARLAAGFNDMAAQLGEGRAMLEAREQELRVLAMEAQAANRAKSDFLAAMSHELRTPLNAIGGYTELMEMGLRGPVTDEQRRDLARIRASQEHLLALIGNVLDLTRVERGTVTYDLASIGVDPLLAGLEGLVLPQAAAKGQSLDYEPCAATLTVLGDRERIRQILLNLLSNAIRYSPTGASITMSARAAASETVSIFVCDTGPGIPADRQASIFEPFVQLDRSLKNPTEGIGLGLAISRDLARGMGGDLTVVSTPGAGTCFVLALPSGILDGATQMTRTRESPAPKFT